MTKHPRLPGIWREPGKRGLQCYACRKPIEIGDEVLLWHLPTGEDSSQVFGWHIECAPPEEVEEYLRDRG